MDSKDSQWQALNRGVLTQDPEDQVTEEERRNAQFDEYLHQRLQQLENERKELMQQEAEGEEPLRCMKSLLSHPGFLSPAGRYTGHILTSIAVESSQEALPNEQSSSETLVNPQDYQDIEDMVMSSAATPASSQHDLERDFDQMIQRRFPQLSDDIVFQFFTDEGNAPANIVKGNAGLFTPPIARESKNPQGSPMDFSDS